ncbi:MAG: hotdog fold thioesterase [Actinophytocola sp.]|nr:hotdog fold thioesterase [Actinophytocola sp.]
MDRLNEQGAELVLPFDPSRTTYADVVHGGAIAALIDVAATAASWASAPVPEKPRGATVGMSVQYLAAGRGDLRARARVLRQGGLTSSDVDVVDGSGTLVAKAMVTYKLG